MPRPKSKKIRESLEKDSGKMEQRRVERGDAEGSKEIEEVRNETIDLLQSKASEEFNLSSAIFDDERMNSNIRGEGISVGKAQGLDNEDSLSLTEWQYAEDNKTNNAGIRALNEPQLTQYQQYLKNKQKLQDLHNLLAYSVPKWDIATNKLNTITEKDAEMMNKKARKS